MKHVVVDLRRAVEERRGVVHLPEEANLPSFLLHTERTDDTGQYCRHMLLHYSDGDFALIGPRSMTPTLEHALVEPGHSALPAAQISASTEDLLSQKRNQTQVIGACVSCTKTTPRRVVNYVTSTSAPTTGPRPAAS